MSGVVSESGPSGSVRQTIHRPVAHPPVSSASSPALGAGPTPRVQETACTLSAKSIALFVTRFQRRRLVGPLANRERADEPPPPRPHQESTPVDSSHRQ